MIVLYEIRCYCGKLLGKVNGMYQIKCPRCKIIVEGTTDQVNKGEQDHGIPRKRT